MQIPGQFFHASFRRDVDTSGSTKCARPQPNVVEFDFTFFQKEDG
jgi:hypothetical protein